jgi:hypothetical protein
MKKLFYLMLTLCANFITPAAYNPDEIMMPDVSTDEPMTDISTLGKRPRTDRNEQDEKKKEEQAK